MVLAAGLLSFGFGIFSPSQAQVAYQLVINPNDAPTVIEQWDQPRGINRLVLYTPKFGARTQTNAFGTEVTLIPAEQNPTNSPETHIYRVVSISPQACASGNTQGGTELGCGNSLIPTNGLVLSAHGNAKSLLAGLSEGQTLQLIPQWFEHSTRLISVINPNLGNNAGACSFPGCRGSGQLVIYTPEFGAERTGTNEFGFEVSVVDGRVVAQEGSDSAIPVGGYVVSGHGSSRDWLIQHAPIGAQLSLSEDQALLASTIDATAYQRQLQARLSMAQRQRVCRPKVFSFLGNPTLSPSEAFALKSTVRRPLAYGNESLSTEAICTAAEKAVETPLYSNGLSNEGGQELNDVIDSIHVIRAQLDNAIWSAHKPFPAGSPHAVWHRPVEQSRAQIGQTLDQWQKAGLNTVFLETYFHGYTLFPSQTMKRYSLPERNPGFLALSNPLQIWLEEAHQRGMKVHCWLEVFYGGNKVAPPSTDAEVGPILAAYPQWANRSFGNKDINATLQPSTLEAGAYFLDPANPEVQTFLLSLFQELSSQYTVDGIQLDYIRYPSNAPKGSSRYLDASWGYTAIARENFKAANGKDPFAFTLEAINKPPAPVVATPAKPLPVKPPVVGAAPAPVVVESQQETWQQWNRFKEEQVTAFVGRVSEMIHTQVNPARLQQGRPPAVLSMAIFPREAEARARKHQDWTTWVTNGWIDWVCPMTLTSATKVVGADTRTVRNVTTSAPVLPLMGRAKVISGIFGPFNGNGPDQILQQLDAAREQDADGFSLFDSAHLTGETLHALQLGVGKKTPPPSFR